ncbi:hypothetical protein VB773_01620 [Haloarculaceae archaeon H-GB2-1]|nr:hypothetical protein [Haloarculaceae archaeon H-GB2-1]
MHRRTFLGTVGATALAGCTATGDDAQTESTGNATTTDGRTATATDTPTETPTETATELPPNPTIEAVNVLTHWEGVGDTLDNATDAVASGAAVKLGIRASIPTDPENVTFEVSYERDGEVVERAQYDASKMATEADSSIRETMGYLYSTDWKRGDYVAKVMAVDPSSTYASENVETEFSVTEPLGADGVALKKAVIPSTVQQGSRSATPSSSRTSTTVTGRSSARCRTRSRQRRAGFRKTRPSAST